MRMITWQALKIAPIRCAGRPCPLILFVVQCMPCSEHTFGRNNSLRMQDVGFHGSIKAFIIHTLLLHFVFYVGDPPTWATSNVNVYAWMVKVLKWIDHRAYSILPTKRALTVYDLYMNMNPAILVDSTVVKLDSHILGRQLLDLTHNVSLNYNLEYCSKS